MLGQEWRIGWKKRKGSWLAQVNEWQSTICGEVFEYNRPAKYVKVREIARETLMKMGVVEQREGETE